MGVFYSCASHKYTKETLNLLAERGIDKKKFYEDCGITSASYSLWNTGKTNPRMKNLEIIADYLHVPVSYLLEGKEQKEKRRKIMEI